MGRTEPRTINISGAADKAYCKAEASVLQGLRPEGSGAVAVK